MAHSETFSSLPPARSVADADTQGGCPALGMNMTQFAIHRAEHWARFDSATQNDLSYEITIADLQPKD